MKNFYLFFKDTVAALIGAGTAGGNVPQEKPVSMPEDILDGVPLGEDRVLDFELGDELDGQPMVHICVLWL